MSEADAKHGFDTWAVNDASDVVDRLPAHLRVPGTIADEQTIVVCNTKSQYGPKINRIQLNPSYVKCTSEELKMHVQYKTWLLKS